MFSSHGGHSADVRISLMFGGHSIPVAQLGPDFLLLDAPDEHPDGFVSRRSGKEPGNVGAERVRGVNVNDEEHDAPNEQSQRNELFH